MRKDGFIHSTGTQQIFWGANKMFITALGTCQMLSKLPLLLLLLLLLLFARPQAGFGVANMQSHGLRLLAALSVVRERFVS